MNEIIVSGLEDSSFQRLQRRAEANKRSLEDEVKHLLTWGVDYIEQIQELARTMKPMKPVVRHESTFDMDAHRAGIEQLLNQAADRDAKLLKELDQDLEDI